MDKRNRKPAQDNLKQTVQWLRDRMRVGVLSFPLTPFSENGNRIKLDVFRRHIRAQVESGAGALFICCGTGEFFSLAEDEYGQLVTEAVLQAAGQVPVFAGIGYGWAQARRFAALAETAGTDGALVLPHYLVGAPQDGLIEQIRHLASCTALPLILYQRGPVKYTPESVAALAEIPNVIGIKDGLSDHLQLQRLKLAVSEEFLFFNGSSTAEMQIRPYQSLGITAYSSAVHSFAPEIASAFFSALHSGDQATIEWMLREFYNPFVALRDRRPGYAISLIKAGARIRGESVGPVRAPLSDPVGHDLEDLQAIVHRGLSLVGARI